MSLEIATTAAVVKVLGDVIFKSKPGLFSSKAQAESFEEKKALVIKGLMQAGIDPDAFDVLIANEMNRRLKTQFGVTFLVFTFVFTTASYGIVVADGVWKLGISPTAITGLVIETPLQFIGLLYIIARNLFPVQKDASSSKSFAMAKLPKADRKAVREKPAAEAPRGRPTSIPDLGDAPA